MANSDGTALNYHASEVVSGVTRKVIIRNDTTPITNDLSNNIN
jgi:hypothetical protein